jgi:hypothetical protein
MQNLFGPLSKEYCLWFYILSIIGMISLILIVLYTLFIGISKRKGLDFYVQMAYFAIANGIFYFQNRLLHTMCTGAV